MNFLIAVKLFHSRDYPKLSDSKRTTPIASSLSRKLFPPSRIHKEEMGKFEFKPGRRPGGLCMQVAIHRWSLIRIAALLNATPSWVKWTFQLSSIFPSVKLTPFA